MKIVPDEMTTKMVDAGMEHTGDPCWPDDVRKAYRAMLAAYTLDEAAVVETMARTVMHSSRDNLDNKMLEFMGINRDDLTWEKTAGDWRERYRTAARAALAALRAMEG